MLPIGAGIVALTGVWLAFVRDEPWQVMTAVAVLGLGISTTFAAMPALIIRAVPRHETGSATSFNHVLRYLGFSAGSALALALLEVFSDDGRLVDRSFTATTLVAAAIWAVTAIVTLCLARPGQTDVRSSPQRS